ncbi:MAG: nucleic acid-binding protein [Coleofasciculus sp. C1-SOL-03]
MVTNPKATPLTLECKQWLTSLLAQGEIVVIPEIADYEVRRELLRVGKVAGIRQLDQLKNTLMYIPIETPVMLLAAQLWAKARKEGRATADPKALDGDVILAAQARFLMANEGNEVIIATTNVRHLSQFVDAREWRLIR